MRLSGIRWSHLALAAAMAAGPAGAEATAAQPAPIYLDQGSAWTETNRADFYTRDQGSRMIPLAWLQALKQPNGAPFLDGALQRYGYLPNPENTDGLPVGFNAAGAPGNKVVGMNCSACHTRQITVNGKDFRIDGGPALVDFQSLLVDLDAAVAAVRASDAAFLAFAKAVLGTPSPAPDAVVRLRADVDLWFLRFDTLVKRAMPTPAWGTGRLDAVSMIFNRVTGLDIGPPPSYIIADNIQRADAPVRYPFLWNAAIQDFTQWPGFAENGSDILGLVRNLGEVYGVFGVFQPRKDFLHLLGIDYLYRNSANFDGLGRLEDLIKTIGAPRYPWPVDQSLADVGAQIYNRKTADGGCNDCHGVRPGQTRFLNNKTWATPLQDVGTDSREYNILGRVSQTGVLSGKKIPVAFPTPLAPTDSSFRVLALSVLGSILQYYTGGILRDPGTFDTGLRGDLERLTDKLKDDAERNFRLPDGLQDLPNAFRRGDKEWLSRAPTSAPGDTTDGPYKYEARVLKGIWATAPYLHAGSVPTLADLLEPVDKRPTSFAIGPNYDPERLGLAVVQPRFPQPIKTGCTDRNSGSSNCGHEYGTKLTPQEKKALLEYLKVL